MTKPLYVTKASGLKEPFSEEKLRRSINKARVGTQLENKLVNSVKKTLYNGIPTSEIYSQIINLIEKSETPHIKGVYGLKNSIMQLGPGGFPFEKFISAVLNNHSYETQTNLILKGRCVDHEIDVLAQKNNHVYLLECKFHNHPGARSDIKVALYTHSRFEDLVNSADKNTPRFEQAWIITNTKTTTEAVKYAACSGMKIIGWSYPEKDNLQDLIEPLGLHPITCLSTLTREQKKLILEYGVVLCKDLLSVKDNILDKIKIDKQLKREVQKEAVVICGFGAEDE